MNESSLAKQVVGIATDTSIEELNEFVANNPQYFQFQPYHERFVEQNTGLLDKVKVAGCVSRVPIYIAFTPVSDQNFNPREVADYVDKRLLEIRRTGVTQSVLDKYSTK